MSLPDSVNIVGHVYHIEYVDKPSDVDIFKRESLWGQIDHWTSTIRVYLNGRERADILHTIIHETLHGIAAQLHLKQLSSDASHDELDILALALADILVRNEWIKDDVCDSSTVGRPA